MDLESEYVRLVNRVELRDLALVDLVHHRAPKITPPLAVTTGLEMRLESVSTEEIVAVGEFTLRAGPREIETEQVSITMKWRLVYGLDTGEEFQPAEDLAKQFVERNGPINLWPYVRETVSTLTGKMGLVPLLLPTLKITR